MIIVGAVVVSLAAAQCPQRRRCQRQTQRLKARGQRRWWQRRGEKIQQCVPAQRQAEPRWRFAQIGCLVAAQCRRGRRCQRQSSCFQCLRCLAVAQCLLGRHCMPMRRHLPIRVRVGSADMLPTYQCVCIANSNTFPFKVENRRNRRQNITKRRHRHNKMDFQNSEKTHKTLAKSPVFRSGREFQKHDFTETSRKQVAKTTGNEVSPRNLDF